jgi:hypothetical protein
MIARLFAVYAALILFAVGCGGRTPAGSNETGGASGAGGGGGGGGPDGAVTGCNAGTVTFHLSAADGRNASYCVGMDCTEQWIVVSTKGGASMPLTLGCNTTCDACTPVGCPAICITPKQMKEDGERLTWDGTFWADATCGANRCRTKQCAAPGKFMARMCATAKSSDAGPFCAITSTARCVDVEFDYPSASLVEGAI